MCMIWGYSAVGSAFVRALQKATLCGLSAKLQSPWRSSYDKAQCHSHCGLQSKMKYKKWGYSAVGSAFEWHSKGQGFDSP